MVGRSLFHRYLKNYDVALEILEEVSLSKRSDSSMFVIVRHVLAFRSIMLR